MRVLSISIAVSLLLVTHGAALAQSKCDSKLTKVAAKKSACKANVMSNAQAKGTIPDAEKLTKCETKFDVACTKAQEAADRAVQLAT